ncbi:hypothetical protein ACF081_17490 [Streptomyces longwoodensis]|uniref:hypothetical protein n=1 Tax=Streptomyces longwoodensis TaxID=68231 RepID=UPI003702A5C2
MRRRIAMVAAVTALMGAGGAVAASPAVAGPRCATGNHCVFWGSIDTARHSYFDTDRDFSNDTFNQSNGTNGGYGQTVNNNVYSASNSSSSGYESHFYDTVGGTGFLFCLNPGDYVDTAGTDRPGTTNGDPLPASLRDRASALVLRGTTSVDCY